MMPSFTQLGLALVRDGRAMGGQPLAPLEARHEVVGGAEEWGAASGAATGGDVHITLEAQRLCLDLRVRHGGLRHADDLSQQLLLSGRKGAIVATAAIRDRVVERLLLRASCCTCLLERPPSALCAVVGHLMLAGQTTQRECGAPEPRAARAMRIVGGASAAPPGCRALCWRSDEVWWMPVRCWCCAAARCAAAARKVKCGRLQMPRFAGNDSK